MTRTSSPTPRSYPPGALLISEVLPAPRDSFDNEWVELYNPGPASVNLDGWRLDDAADGGAQLLTSLLEPGAYLVVNLMRPLLNNGGDTVRLIAPDGTLIDSFTYVDISPDASSARELPTGRWSSDLRPSPGGPSQPVAGTLPAPRQEPTTVEEPVEAEAPQLASEDAPAPPSGTSVARATVRPTATWPVASGPAPTYAGASWSVYTLTTATPHPEPGATSETGLPGITAEPPVSQPGRSPWLAAAGLALIVAACALVLARLDPEAAE